MAERRLPFDAASYIERSKSGPCFICRIVAGDPRQTEHIVHRDDRHIAFLPSLHVQRGYALVAPVEHREAVVEDFSLDEYLELQRLVHRVAGALADVVPTERVYILSLGSQQGNAHVHWHVVALPPGVPYEQQQFNALMAETRGVLDLSDDDRRELAHRIRTALITDVD
jgi:diadenosine tetraphosphate (Ap4A) HIT family hydrolase